MDYRTAKAKARRPTERQVKAAKNLAAGMTIMAAMTDAGYTAKTANQGMQKVPLTVQALTANDDPLVLVGKNTSMAAMRNLVLGRLVTNLQAGSDKGVLSAKALGSIKELSMFTPDVQAGVVVLNMPVTAKPNDLPESED